MEIERKCNFGTKQAHFTTLENYINTAMQAVGTDRHINTTHPYQFTFVAVAFLSTGESIY